MKNQKLLLQGEVLRRLRCSRTALYRLRQSGNFPKAIKHGRVLKWLEVEIDEWLERSERVQ